MGSTTGAWARRRARCLFAFRASGTTLADVGVESAGRRWSVSFSCFQTPSAPTSPEATTRVPVSPESPGAWGREARPHSGQPRRGNPPLCCTIIVRVAGESGSGRPTDLWERAPCAWRFEPASWVQFLRRRGTPRCSRAIPPATACNGSRSHGADLPADSEEGTEDEPGLHRWPMAHAATENTALNSGTDSP